MEYAPLVNPPLPDLLAPMVELCVGDKTILPFSIPDSNPNWIYIRYRRQDSPTIHCTAINIHHSLERFSRHSVAQQIFTVKESLVVYQLAAAFHST